jgi:hypothetical protein
VSSQPARKCTGCGVTKPLNDFHPRSDGKGLRSKCKPCHRADGRRRWSESATQTQRDRCYDGWLRRTYGISLEDYNAMADSQGWLCAICGDDPKVVYANKSRNAQRLVLDHCHTTGRIRGLLCGPCNRALAPLERSPVWVRRAVAYLNAIPAE